ncbi:MAG: PQQ-binding-like beta-propeller repeat protein [Haloarculaceae archaeon]
MVDGDVYARSATACVGLAPDGTERWRRPLDPLVYDEFNLGDSTATQVVPAVTDDGVYVPDRDALVGLDRETERERWRVPSIRRTPLPSSTTAASYSSPVVAAGRAFVVGPAGLFALRPDESG